MNVLISDALISRKSFDVFNSLKHSHPEIRFILTHNGEINSPVSLKSKLIFGCEIFCLRNDSNYESDLLSILDMFQEVVVLPLEESYMLKLYKYLSRTSDERIKCNFPLLEAFNTARDKHELMLFCEMKGVGSPKLYTRKNYNELYNDFSPIVIKPVNGSGSEGVVFIRDLNSLQTSDSIDFESNVIQQLIGDPVKVVGMFYLYDNGELKLSYGHKRIRTYPLTGGVTTYSELFHDDKALNTGKKLLDELEWSGVAMVEMLYDSISDDYKVIEVNPRLWGSILLGEYAGYDFLYNYILTACDKDVEVKSSKSEAYIRWVFPFEVLSYLKSNISNSQFWKYDLNNTCYINFTFSSKIRSMLFLFFSVFNLNNVKKYIRKVT